MTLNDALAAALRRNYTRLVEDEAAAILRDPAFREELTAALAEALRTERYYKTVTMGDGEQSVVKRPSDEFAAAIVAAMLPCLYCVDPEHNPGYHYDAEAGMPVKVHA